MAGFLDILNAIGPYIKTGGEIAGQVGANRAQGRAAEGVAGQAQDRNAQERYRIEQLAKLGAANLTEQATQDRADRYLTSSKARAQQVGLGDLLQNVQPVSIGGLPSYIPKINISGGLTPAAFSGMTRQAGGNLSRQALEAQMSGADIPNLPDVSQLGTNAPAITPLPEPGLIDKILSGLGYAGAGLGAIDEIQKQRPQTPPPLTPQTGRPAAGPPPQASAGGVRGQTPPLENRLTTMQLLQLIGQLSGKA